MTTLIVGVLQYMAVVFPLRKLRYEPREKTRCLQDNRVHFTLEEIDLQVEDANLIMQKVLSRDKISAIILN